MYERMGQRCDAAMEHEYGFDLKQSDVDLNQDRDLVDAVVMNLKIRSVTVAVVE